MYIYGNIILFFKGLMHFQDRIQQSRHRGKFDDVLGGSGKGEMGSSWSSPATWRSCCRDFWKKCHSKLTHKSKNNGWKRTSFLLGRHLFGGLEGWMILPFIIWVRILYAYPKLLHESYCELAFPTRILQTLWTLQVPEEVPSTSRKTPSYLG